MEGKPKGPRPPEETNPFLPRVDPDGDVWLPLRDHYYLKGGYFGFTFFPGNFRYVPRVYLMSGGAARGIAPEPDDNASHFERSLQKHLNKGLANECLSLKCTYPPHINFNTFLVDLNGDSLPDLISAAPPRQWQDGMGPLTTCEEGHRIHLNRGYAFEEVPFETFAHAWVNNADEGSALRLLANRDRLCDVVNPKIDDDVARYPAIPGIPGGFPMPAYPAGAMAQVDLDGDGRGDMVFA
jgi:hypothetical protein